MRRMRFFIAAMLGLLALNFVLQLAGPHPTVDFNIFYRGDYSGTNLNPPAWVYVFRSLRVLGHAAAYWLLVAVSAVIYAWFVWKYARGLKMVWLLAHPAFWTTLYNGQIYVLLLVFVVAGYYARSGIGQGLMMATKPNFVVWPLFLWLKGERSLTPWVAAGIVSLLPLLGGIGLYEDYFGLILDRGPVNGASNVSLPGLLGGYHVPIALAGLGPLALFVWRTKPSHKDTSDLALLAVLIVSPLTWVGYLLFSLPVLLSRSWGRPEVLIATLQILPLYGDFSEASAWRALNCAGLILLFGCVLIPLLRREHIPAAV
jgi:hypothetical protein